MLVDYHVGVGLVKLSLRCTQRADWTVLMQCVVFFQAVHSVRQEVEFVEDADKKEYVSR